MLRIRRINPFDLFVRQVAIASIKLYQRYISPHKGFACAHRVLYGGDSCSGYIKRAIAQNGLLEAWNSAGERFQACKEASLILRSQQSEDSESQKQNRQRSENHCQNAITSCECSQFGYEACTLVSCESCVALPDCGSLDFISCCGSGAFAPLTPRLLDYIRYNKRR